MDALDDAERGVGPLQLLAQQREGDVVLPAPPYAVRDRRPEEAQRAQLREDLAMDLALLVPLRMCGRISARRTRAPSAGRGAALGQRRSRSGPSPGDSRRRRPAGPYTRPMNTAVDRHASSPDAPTRLRGALGAASLADPRPLLPAFVGARRGPRADRHGRPALPRLRVGHRRTVPRPPPPAVTRPSTSRSTSSLHICNALGYLEPVGRLAEMIADVMPGRRSTRVLRELGLGGDRGGAQARPAGDRPAGDDRLQRRLPRPDVRLGQRDHVEHQLPDGLRAAAAVGVYIAPYPNVYRDFGGDEQAAIDGAGRPPPHLRRGDRAVAGRRAS